MIRNLLRWARVVKSGSDDKPFAVQQVEYSGKTADCFMVFPYGVHANLPPDSLGLMFSLQGHAENRAAICWTPKDRPQLAEGEVAFYHPPTDATIIWKANGDLDIETGEGGLSDINVKAKNVNIEATESMTFDTPSATFTGDVDIQGATSMSATVTSNGKDISDTHTHTGSPTAPAGGISNTGTPI